MLQTIDLFPIDCIGWKENVPFTPSKWSTFLVRVVICITYSSSAVKFLPCCNIMFFFFLSFSPGFRSHDFVSAYCTFHWLLQCQRVSQWGWNASPLWNYACQGHGTWSNLQIDTDWWWVFFTLSFFLLISPCVFIFLIFHLSRTSMWHSPDSWVNKQISNQRGPWRVKWCKPKVATKYKNVNCAIKQRIKAARGLRPGHRGWNAQGDSY